MKKVSVFSLSSSSSNKNFQESPKNSTETELFEFKENLEQTDHTLIKERRENEFESDDDDDEIDKIKKEMDFEDDEDLTLKNTDTNSLKISGNSGFSRFFHSVPLIIQSVILFILGTCVILVPGIISLVFYVGKAFFIIYLY